MSWMRVLKKACWIVYTIWTNKTAGPISKMDNRRNKWTKLVSKACSKRMSVMGSRINS